MSTQEKTHWKKFMNPDYFGSWSIPEGKDLILTMDHIQMEKVTGPGGREEQLPVLHFKDDVKPLVLNVTNSRQIESLYGTPYVEDWGGKKIQVFTSTTKLKGEEVDCVRIRPMVPIIEKPEFTPENSRWSGAVESIAKGDSTIQAIKKHFNLSEENEALLKAQIQDVLQREEVL
jgi:hypothetical protein